MNVRLADMKVSRCYLCAGSGTFYAAIDNTGLLRQEVCGVCQGTGRLLPLTKRAHRLVKQEKEERKVECQETI